MADVRGWAGGAACAGSAGWGCASGAGIRRAEDRSVGSWAWQCLYWLRRPLPNRPPRVSPDDIAAPFRARPCGGGRWVHPPERPGRKRDASGRTGSCQAPILGKALIRSSRLSLDCVDKCRKTRRNVGKRASLSPSGAGPPLATPAKQVWRRAIVSDMREIVFATLTIGDFAPTWRESHRMSQGGRGRVSGTTRGGAALRRSPIVLCLCE